MCNVCCVCVWGGGGGGGSGKLHITWICAVVAVAKGIGF